jgi:hypothetical protein
MGNFGLGARIRAGCSNRRVRGRIATSDSAYSLEVRPRKKRKIALKLEAMGGISSGSGRKKTVPLRKWSERGREGS